MPTGVYTRKKGRTLSESHRKKIGLAHSGKKMSDETKRRVSERKKKLFRERGYAHTPEAIEKIRASSLGRPRSAETRKKLSDAITGEKNYFFGKKRTLQERLQRSEKLKGAKSPHWRGGLTPKNTKIRNSIEYRLWRESVFKRDDYTCQGCSKRGVYLNADHIKPFSLHPELRFELSNGRTLCVECHEKYGWRPGREPRVENTAKETAK